MKHITWALVALALVLLPFAGAVDAGKDKAEKRCFLVVANGNSLPAGLASSIESAGGELLRTIDKVGVAVAETTDANFVKKARKIKGVTAVVGNAWLPGSKAHKIEKATSSHFGDGVDPSDDSLYFLLWGLDAIQAPDAWDEGATGEGAVVAVLDTGVSSTHPDIAANVLVSLGKSFAYDLDGNLEDWDPEDSMPAGAFNHGTHVAGIIAGVDDDAGIIGVAPDAKILPVQVLSRSLGGYGTFDWIINGIVYAADSGADVINMSLSGYVAKNGYYDEFEDRTYTASEVAEQLIGIKRAMRYADKKGCTIVASLGNEAIDLDHNASWVVSPAEQTPCIAISATGPLGIGVDPTTSLTEPAVYTNYGQSAVDLAGPGGNFDEELANAGGPFWFDFVLSLGLDGSYYWAAGTSMAAPHVAGVAALIIGENGGSMSPTKVYKKMRKTAEDLGKPGRDDYYGHGHVNAYQAVK